MANWLSTTSVNVLLYNSAEVPSVAAIFTEDAVLSDNAEILYIPLTMLTKFMVFENLITGTENFG